MSKLRKSNKSNGKNDGKNDGDSQKDAANIPEGNAPVPRSIGGRVVKTARIMKEGSDIAEIRFFNDEFIIYNLAWGVEVVPSMLEGMAVITAFATSRPVAYIVLLEKSERETSYTLYDAEARKTLIPPADKYGTPVTLVRDLGDGRSFEATFGHTRSETVSVGDGE